MGSKEDPYSQLHGEHKHEHHGKSGEHKHEHHRFDDPEKWIKMFEDPNRDNYQKPDKVFEVLGIGESNFVADIGSATGYFPVRLSKVAKKGKIFACDVEENMVKYLANRVKEEGIVNIVCIKAEVNDPKIPEPVHVILSVNTYHHFENRPTYFAKLSKKLKPGGKIAIIDWRKGELPFGPLDYNKFTQSQVIKEMEEANYKFIQEPDLGTPYHYLLIFQSKNEN